MAKALQDFPNQVDISLELHKLCCKLDEKLVALCFDRDYFSEKLQLAEAAQTLVE